MTGTNMSDKLHQARAEYERATPNPLNIPDADTLREQYTQATGRTFQRTPLQPMQVSRTQKFVTAYGIGVLLTLGLILYFVR